MDLFFVNTLSLPVNSGMVAYLLLLIIGLGYASYRAYLKGHVRLNVILLSTTMLFVGYSSYAMVTIRAAANPPINCSNPSNPHALHSFLNRDQYGDKPLLWGAYYSAPFDGYSTRSFYSLDEDGRYIKRSSIDGYTHASEHMRFFPRMWDSQRAEGDYKPWAAYRTKEQGVEFGHEKRYKDQIIIEPTFGENLYFFFNYQLRHMFWRYFMWNFVGRQSDIQPSGVTLTDGNWLSGVDFIDKVYLGTQSNLPREVESNRGRNRYYFLPFILGFIGLLFQLYRDPKNFSIVMWLFIMMGIALVVYFNTSPSEPRERDYVYAGAFYSFSSWDGLGVVAIYNLLKGVTKGDGLKRVVATAIISLCVPAILLAENWDDHDRSHRTFARDVGWNYLQSTLPNSIILNYGDNDTFPLWFNQEVDGVRSDVRIMNSAYLNEAWYIDQMKRKTYESDPVPFSLPASKYSYTNDYLPVNGDAGQVVTIGDVVDFVRNDDPRTKVMLRDGSRSDYILSNRIAIPVNKQNAVESGIVKREDAHLILDTLLITLNRGSIDKSQLMILDLLANFDWERPIYFTQTNIPQALGLLDFLQFDGYGYRLVPISTPYTNLRRVGRIDCDYAASLLLNTFRYGNLDDKRVYVDNFIQYSISASKSREAFARVADEYILRGDNKKGVQLLDAGLKFFPISQIRFTSANTLPLIRSYYRAGAMVKGDALAKIFAENAMEYVEYYQQFDGDKRAQVDPLIKSKLSDLEQLYHIAAAANRVDLIDWLNSLKA